MISFILIWRLFLLLSLHFNWIPSHMHAVTFAGMDSAFCNIVSLLLSFCRRVNVLHQNAGETGVCYRFRIFAATLSFLPTPSGWWWCKVLEAFGQNPEAMGEKAGSIFWGSCCRHVSCLSSSSSRSTAYPACKITLLLQFSGYSVPMTQFVLREWKWDSDDERDLSEGTKASDGKNRGDDDAWGKRDSRSLGSAWIPSFT